MRQAILVVFLLLALCPSPGAAKFDPSFVWTTVETPHFLIHHHQNSEEIAKRAAVLAEDIHNRLVPRIKWEPKNKTHLVLVDAMDEANGYSTPVPYNEVVIYLSAPAGETGLGLTSYDDWLRMVITHEYTHTLQLDMVREGPARLQKVLGRIYFPNLFQPLWMIEGLATYEETEQTSGGRGRSAWEDMVFRAATLENAFPDLAQASVVPDTWPGGLVPYLFGEGFIRFLADTFGRERVADMSLAYSGRSWPLLVQSTGNRVLRQRYDELWIQWRSALRERYERQRREIGGQAVTAPGALTERGYINAGPAYSPDGSKIAYAVVHADEYPGVHVMNADGTEDRRIAENIFPSSASGTAVTWGPGGKRLLYTRVDMSRNTNYYSDLYSYDLEAKQEKRLTKGLRGRDPHLSPDGTKLLFVMNRLGRTRLATIDPGRLNGRPAGEQDVVPLSEWSENQYETPHWSPDGTRIAVTVRQAGGFRDIWMLDAAGNRIAEVSHDRALEGAASWSSDGKYLYFSSDRSGVYNIYACETGSGKIYRVSNVMYGAFSPSPSPDNAVLAVSSYSAKGFDIALLKIPGRGAWIEAPAYVDAYPVMRYEDKPVVTASRPYSPFSTIYPRFWIPWFGYSEESGMMYGALTFGQDAVQRHSYTATGYYGPQKSRFWYEVDYLYDGWQPTAHLHASDVDNTYSDFLHDSLSRRAYVERERIFGAALIMPVLKNARQQTITAGYRRRELSALTDLPPWAGYAGPLPAEGVLASGRLVYLFNNSRMYALSFSPEDGRTLSLGAERYAEALGSIHEFTKYTADWHEYLDLPGKHQVLLGRFFVGASTGDAPPQGAYQLGGDSPGDVIVSLGDQAVYLRGYPVKVLQGGKLALGSLEYRFPMTELDKGWNTKAIYLRKLHGALFYEAGSAWDGTFHGDYLRKSVGGELRFDLAAAYYLPITFRFVFAKGLDEDGLAGTYIGLWVPLEL